MMLIKRRWQHYLLNFSPWILAIACLLLTGLLGVFTISNYQREKQLLFDGISQKGLALVRFINSNIQNSIRDDLLSERFEVSRWKTHISDALNQASEQPGVDFILLLDGNTKIISSAGEKLPPVLISETISAFRDLGLQESSFEAWKSRIITDSHNSKRKFQLAMHYRPLDRMGRRTNKSNSKRMKGGRMKSRFSHHSEFDQYEKEFFQLVQQRPYFVIQLDFEKFSSPLDRQLIQIVILSLVTILVGIGGMLSFATLNGLRGSQLRIGKMQAFTDILVSTLPVGLIATNSGGTIQICNDAIQELLEVSEGGVMGKIPLDCLDGKVASAFIGSSADSHNKQDKEIEIFSDAGKKRSLHLASKVVFDKDGSFAGEVLLIRDLTELKYLEKKLQRSERMAAIGKMAAGVAHELRNPLSSIKGLSVLLKSMVGNNGKGVDTAEILVKEVERLNRSIGELLDYAKPAILEKEEASIVDILEKTKSLIDIDANFYGVEIKLERKEDLPPIKIDKDKINQLFLNLFLNSLQAMPDGGRLEVVVSLENSSICVNVRDNGMGIEPENLNRVLDPYFTTKSDGTGLGLSMSSKIVEEHGGQLVISSKIGEYTNVRVVLPYST